MKKLLVASLLIVSGCSASTETAETDLPNITTGAFPIAWLSSRLAADCATVTDLTPAGGDVHDLELSPAQTAAVVDAQLIITVSGFQPAFDDAVTTSTAPVLDLIDAINPITGHDHDHDHADDADHDHGHDSESESKADSDILDPHFWLDPNRTLLAAAAIRDQVSKLSTYCAEVAATNFTSLQAELIALDLDYGNKLSQCASNTLVVSHEAFGYLGDAYDLEQIAVTGLDPESEPSAARISEIIELAKSKKVMAVFTEESANPAVADILASELGVGVLPLNPIELKPASMDYLVEMQQNLLNLTKGLDCR